MLAWDIPSEDWDKLTVKTAQFIAQSQQLTILRSNLPTDWQLEDIARDFGPGQYRIQAGPGPYRGRNTTINVDARFAREAGWEPAPPMPQPIPTPQDQLAARTFQQATQGAVDPVSLAAMVQTAVQNAMAHAQPAAVDPLAMVLKGFELANTMTSRSMELAKGMVGVPDPKDGPRDWPDVIMELGPKLLDTLQGIVPLLRPTPPAAAPVAGHVQPVTTQQTLQTGNPPEHTVPNPPQLPQPPTETVPLLRLMQMNAALLKPYLAGPASAEDLAQQLSGLVGPDIDPAVHATAAHVEQYGPAILAHADPTFATARAADVIIQWSRLLNTPDDEASDLDSASGN